MQSVIAHYQEIALKGRNRPWFLRRLIRNLHTAAVGPRCARDSHADGPHRDPAWPRCRLVASARSVGAQCGLANFSLARRTGWDLEGLAAAIVEHLPSEPVANFRVAVRRADKTFPIPSPEVERVIGRRIQDARGWPVDLSNPSFVIGVEIVPGAAFYYYDKIPGIGGLPVGTQGESRSSCRAESTLQWRRGG